MRALAAFPKEKRLRVIDAPAPALTKDTEVRLRMLEVGVCGTDKEIARFDYGTPPDGSDYLIVGHESLGEVVEVGAAVKGLAVGDLAVPTVRRPCAVASCAPCRAGRQDFCETGGFVERGINRRHGYAAESVVEEAAYVVRVPKELREVAVLTEPLTIAEKAVSELARVESRLPWRNPGGALTGDGRHALVLGAGPVGLLGAALLKLKGYTAHVYSQEPPTDEKARAAAGLGADYISAAACPLGALAERLPDIDVIYEATGASQFSFDAMELLGVNGTFILTGVPGRKGTVSLPGGELMRRLVLENQAVFGTVNAPRAAFEAAAADLAALRARDPKAVAALVSARHPLADFEGALAGRLPGIKHVLTLS